MAAYLVSERKLGFFVQALPIHKWLKVDLQTLPSHFMVIGPPGFPSMNFHFLNRWLAKNELFNYQVCIR